MEGKTLQIDVMGSEPDILKFRDDELIRCKLYVDGRACIFWTTEANYKALVYDGFFVRDGKDNDSSGAVNTTNVFREVL